MFKKLLSVILVLSMLLSFAACSSRYSRRNRNDDDDDEELTEETVDYAEAKAEIEEEIQSLKEQLFTADDAEALELQKKLNELENELIDIEIAMLEQPAETTYATEAITTATTAEQTTKSPYISGTNIPTPGTIDISGDFNILVSGNYVWNDFESIDYSDNVIDHAVYERNRLLSSNYGVEIVTDDVTQLASTTTPGNGPGFQKIYAEFMTGTSMYDAAAIGTYDVVALANNGFLWNLKDVPGIDLSKEYWDQKAENDLSVLGKLYYTTGDIGVVNDKATHAILFNKDMVSDYALENPYELVRSNQWTLEKFTSLVKRVGEDLNQNGLHDENDVYGLVTWNDSLTAILGAAGEKIAGVNDNGEIELTLLNERVVSLYDKFCNDLVFDFAHSYNYQYDSATGKATPSSEWNTNRDDMFLGNRALFLMNTLSAVERYRDEEMDFGILPYPKLDDTQEYYGSEVSAYYSQFVCVPLVAENPERSGTVLELLAYYGNNHIVPAYYDTLLVGRYVRDVESADMLDIIRCSKVYDIGAFYKIGTINTQIGQMFVSRNSIEDIVFAFESAAKSKVDHINSFFQKLMY